MPVPSEHPFWQKKRKRDRELPLTDCSPTVMISRGINRRDRMKISTKGRYALRLMLDIAIHNNGLPVKLKDVAARQEISVKYLESIVSILTKAGYVQSIRGSQGGYLLTKEPSQYTVGNILRLTEGSMSPVDCLEGTVNRCVRAEGCVTLRVWKELDEAIKSVIDRYTLEDLVQWEMEKGMDYII